MGGVIHQPYHNYKANENCTGKKNTHIIITYCGNIVVFIQGRTLWGLIGLGVGGFVPSCPPPDKFIVTTTRSHADATVNKTLDALHADEVIRVGGAGHKVFLLCFVCLIFKIITLLCRF